MITERHLKINHLVSITLDYYVAVVVTYLTGSSTLR